MAVSSIAGPASGNSRGATTPDTALGGLCNASHAGKGQHSCPIIEKLPELTRKGKQNLIRLRCGGLYQAVSSRLFRLPCEPALFGFPFHHKHGFKPFGKSGFGQTMNFASDNWVGAHPEISKALADANGGFVPAYGSSELDRKVQERFNALFGRDVAVFFVGTGTAANSLALSAAARPGGVTFCQREAHVIADECGAPEFFTGGGRLLPVDGPMGKIDPENLRRALGQFEPGFVHAGQPMAVTITQATEAGVVYTPGEVAAIAAVCREHGIPLHMDGARFANALASLGVSARAMTIDCGVDMLSFGATKNGCWCAEALVVFTPGLATQLPFLRKRGAQLFSKSRFIAAQFDAYFEGDLWLRLAAHANAMAASLAGHARRSVKLRLAWEPQANEVFIAMPQAVADALRASGVLFYPWAEPAFFAGSLRPGEILTRFVTSFATDASEIDAFGKLAG
jgi:threonine aldolase